MGIASVLYVNGDVGAQYSTCVCAGYGSSTVKPLI